MSFGWATGLHTNALIPSPPPPPPPFSPWRTKLGLQAYGLSPSVAHTKMRTNYMSRKQKCAHTSLGLLLKSFLPFLAILLLSDSSLKTHSSHTQKKKRREQHKKMFRVQNNCAGFYRSLATLDVLLLNGILYVCMVVAPNHKY